MGIKTDHVSYAECDGATGNLRAPCATARVRSPGIPGGCRQLAVAGTGWVQEGPEVLLPDPRPAAGRHAGRPRGPAR